MPAWPQLGLCWWHKAVLRDTTGTACSLIQHSPRRCCVALCRRRASNLWTAQPNGHGGTWMCFVAGFLAPCRLLCEQIRKPRLHMQRKAPPGGLRSHQQDARQMKQSSFYLSDFKARKKKKMKCNIFHNDTQFKKKKHFRKHKGI